MKKFFLYSLMIMTFFGVVNVYAAEGHKAGIRISCDDIKFYQVDEDTQTPIDGPVPGAVKVDVTLSNYGDTDEQVLLVVASVNKKTGIFEYAESNSALISAGSSAENISASVIYPNTSDYEYKYFLWDSLKRMIPLGNKAPLAPTEISVEATTTKIVLSWQGAEDDVEISKYNVYRNDELVASTADALYTDSNLITGEDFSYKVTAVDELGAESSLPLTKEANTLSVASLDLTDNYDGSSSGKWTGTLMSITGKESANIDTAFPPTADKAISWGTKEDISGAVEDCLCMTVSAKLYVNLEADLTQASDKPVSIILKYLDSDAKNLIIDYKDINDNTKQVKIAKTDTGLWKTAEFVIEDMKLDNSYNASKPSCFRINNNVATATPLYLAEIKVALGYDGEISESSHSI